jgi:hypothetical protein
VHNRIVSAVNRAVCNRMLVRYCWCDVIVLNVQAIRIKDGFYEELGHIQSNLQVPYENFVRIFQWQSR